MKTRLSTTHLSSTRLQRSEPLEDAANNFRAVVVFAPKISVDWRADGTFATVRVEGKDADAAADTIKRALLHRYPMKKETPADGKPEGN